MLTATDLSTLYRLRVTERLFDDKCRRLNFGAGDDRHSGLCELLRQSVQSNTEERPRVTHVVSGVRGSDSSAAVMQLTFTLRVGAGAGLDVECTWQLPSLVRLVRQSAPREEERKEQDDPKHKKRRAVIPAEDDLDSLDFPDLPDELLTTSSRPHSSTAAVASQTTADDEAVWMRELSLITHRLLDLHLASPTAASFASSTTPQSTAALEVTQLKEQVRLLEQQVATEAERAERAERELRSGGGNGNGGAGGNGGGAGHDVVDKRKPRQMSDRSVINPAMRKRKARGIHLDG